ncbi:putative neuroglian-like isoform 2 [Apostichopus japonicus]|uniref:Putative neuroglian-like isoform 2 n=1 Tax=Stichopus japonicus TaxID=307972 RepID=A0A2G8K8T9_STIJA|nr:putative neuroglian-like isoform 2 [Apostichopus japonicus]
MSEDNVACKENYYIHRYSSANISCDHDTSFYTVRWYFNDNEVSFLLIDGGSKGGSGYESGEYDITEEGVMIIKRAETKHEGSYKIVVLGKGGLGGSQTMMVYVTVPVETLSIVDCTTSTSELCKDKDKITSSLICEARDYWPSVKLQWMQISENGSTVVPTNTSMTFDTTSLLYNSSSVLEYIPELFSYQYFTCVAIGNAAYKVSNNSMTMKGNLPFHEIPRKDVYVMKGKDLTLYCPHDNFPFGQLQVQHRDGTDNVIKVFNSYCPNDGSCAENEGRVTTIENVNNDDDGLYQCISSNGVNATKNETDVTTVIFPDNLEPIFGACGSMAKCTQPLYTSGSGNCSISGAKPPVKLSMKADDLSKDLLTIHTNDESIVHDDSTGTSTTTITFNYEVPKCTDSVTLRCVPEPVEYNRPIEEATLQLESETSNCPEKGGSPALIVILIIFIVVVISVVLAVYIYKRRTGVNLLTEVLSTARAKCNNGREELGEISEEEEPLKTSNQAKVETPKQSFLKLICLFCEKLEQGKVDPFPFLDEFVETEQLENEVAMKIAIHFAECKRNDWIISSKVAKLLNTVLEKQQLSLVERIGVFGQMYEKGQINTDEYILVTISLFTDKKDDFEKALVCLTSKTSILDHELLKKLLQCLDAFLNRDYEVLKPKLNQDDQQVQVIISPEPDSNADEDNRIMLLKSISSCENANGIFLKLLLLGIQSAGIDYNIFITIMRDCKDEISTKMVISLLAASRRSNLDTDTFFALQLTTLLLNEMLSMGEYLEELKTSLEENLISKECLVAQLDGCIQSDKLTNQSLLETYRKSLEEDWITFETLQQKIGDKWEKEEWVKLLLPIAIRHQHENEKPLEMLTDVIKKYQIKMDDMKTILDSAGVSLEISTLEEAQPI